MANIAQLSISMWQNIVAQRRSVYQHRENGSKRISGGNDYRRHVAK